MGIKRETQYYIECDICDDTFETYAGDRKTAVISFRENGWKIGKKCICSDCDADHEDQLNVKEEKSKWKD